MSFVIRKRSWKFSLCGWFPPQRWFWHVIQIFSSFFVEFRKTKGVVKLVKCCEMAWERMWQVRKWRWSFNSCVSKSINCNIFDIFPFLDSHLGPRDQAQGSRWEFSARYFAHKTIRQFGGNLALLKFTRQWLLNIKIHRSTQKMVIRMDTKIDYLLVFIKLKWLNRRIRA